MAEAHSLKIIATGMILVVTWHQGTQGACIVPQEILDGLKTRKEGVSIRKLAESSVAISQPGIQLKDLSLFNPQTLFRACCVPGTVLGAWDTPVNRHQYLPSWRLHSSEENLPWMGTDKSKVELWF